MRRAAIARLLGSALDEGDPGFKITFRGPSERTYEVCLVAASEADATERAVRAWVRPGAVDEFGTDPMAHVVELEVRDDPIRVPECTVSWNGYRAVFEIDAFEPLDLVCNVDVEVYLPDGSWRWAVMFTPDEVARRLKHWEDYGDDTPYVGGPGSLIVREPGIRVMCDVIEHIIASGNFATMFLPAGDSAES